MSHHDPLIQSSQFAHNDNALSHRQDERVYRAFTSASRQQSKLMLYTIQGGIMGMPSYNHYVDAICVSPKEFWIVFSTAVLRCKGEHLSTDILILLQDNRLRSLHCFHEQFFDAPEAGSPIIREIQRYTMQHYQEQVLNGTI